jgi:hypothetical protein
MEATADSNGNAMTSGEFDCPSCGHRFPQGDGGETGGMCGPCFDAELRNAHEQAAKNPAEDAGLDRRPSSRVLNAKRLSLFVE